MTFTETQLLEAFDEYLRRNPDMRNSSYVGVAPALIKIMKAQHASGKPYVIKQHVAYKDDEMGIRKYIRDANFRKI